MHIVDYLLVLFKMEDTVHPKFQEIMFHPLFLVFCFSSLLSLLVAVMKCRNVARYFTATLDNDHDVNDNDDAYTFHVLWGTSRI